MRLETLTDVVVGVDVGGSAKGFHGVAISREGVVSYRSSEAVAIADWCREMGAAVIGVDAPCGWSSTGKSRPAELALKKQHIQCFSTPMRQVALAHPKDYYGWMFAGERLYTALAANWTLYTQDRLVAGTVFETFPHAVVCALAGKVMTAKPKAPKRRAVLREWGIDATKLRSIDFVDAGLCALTAAFYLAGDVRCLGDEATGFIVVPSTEDS